MYGIEFLLIGRFENGIHPKAFEGVFYGRKKDAVQGQICPDYSYLRNGFAAAFRLQRDFKEHGEEQPDAGAARGSEPEGNHDGGLSPAGNSPDEKTRVLPDNRALLQESQRRRKPRAGVRRAQEL